MKEIPITYVKSNQVILVILTFSSILLQNSWLLVAAFLFVAVPLLLGPKGNLAFYVAKRFFSENRSGKTEAAELQKFNQTIAGILLTIAVAIHFLTASWIAWIFVGMVTLAATIALLGFCVGCFLYFQWKRYKYKLKN
ncbi:DUF4395 domain-containing protein [Anaerobacillus alkaliphilus]|uniref:DUF4395 domain-containing protein n=1 Tax=Anaerobacillus alkaliphilus TaxID=1548597 RepID=A0A4Q0VY81_9BACI|nr:DUF4395 domain-containing protein [Anaerobacillus alkaliphilus]RXJ04146.1 DUF4395 domain-containing protein [Anaerobacillus alkaliphilus]